MQLSKLSPRRIAAFVARQFRDPVPDFYGVYAAFSEVPDENPWSKSPWIEFNIGKLERIDRSRFAREHKEHFFVPSTNVVPALLINQSSRPLTRVLDLGGGTGNSYYAICRHLIDPAKVEWLVVDSNPALYEAGKRYAETRPEPPPIFCDQLPDGPIHIVHIAGTLQCIEDYTGLIETLATKYQPEQFVLTRTYAGHIQTFVTRQVVRGSNVPCKFVNIDELRACLEALGYEEILCAPCNDFETTQFRDIPEAQQLRTSLDMVWRRSRQA